MTHARRSLFRDHANGSFRRRQSMTAFFHHFMYDFRTGLRDKTLLLMNYLFPLGFYILMGLLMTGLNPTFSPTMIPTMILVAMMANTLLGLPNPIVDSREAGTFRPLKT